jgi:UDP-GlcNAc:undecaprenyl-phosphate/decaprenyl-phosphate GlcNAc-1-phosphate transferase
MVKYLLIYLISMLLALIITPVVIYIARRFNAVDKPDIRRVHTKPVGRVGGIAIFIPAMSVILYVFFGNGIGKSANIQGGNIAVLFIAAAFIFLVGLVDDIRHLRAGVKFLCQLAAAIAICATGYRIGTVLISENVSVNFGLLSWPVTIFWIVGITNAVNLIDGLDGLAAGLSAVACGVLAILSIYFSQPFMTVISLSLLGALTGFLYFNFNPAKIFMGDCGSLFLGFTIASASIMFAAKTQAMVSLTLPILALGIPIFDTLFSVLRRFLERRSLFSPDNEHFHHKLLALGLKQRHIVLGAYLITLLATGFGMFMMVTRSWQTILIFACIVILMGLVFRAIGLVRLRQTLWALKQKYVNSNIASHEKEGFENARLYFSNAGTFEQWWQSVCLAGEKMDFTVISLPVTRRSGEKELLRWNKGDNIGDSRDVIKMIIPIRDRRSESALELEVGIKTNGSLESAGRRVRLFNRLIDEYGIAKIGQKAKMLIA